jgi:hypothetical protein
LIALYIRTHIPIDSAKADNAMASKMIAKKTNPIVSIFLAYE